MRILSLNFTIQWINWNKAATRDRLYASFTHLLFVFLSSLFSLSFFFVVFLSVFSFPSFYFFGLHILLTCFFSFSLSFYAVISFILLYYIFYNVFKCILICLSSCLSVSLSLFLWLPFCLSLCLSVSLSISTVSASLRGKTWHTRFEDEIKNEKCTSHIIAYSADRSKNILK